MANKKITDYQLIAAITSTVNFFVDDLTQNYRATAEQIKNYVLANGNGVTAFLADLSVTTAKLAAGAVTDAKTNFTPPTVTRLTSGSGTYTTPAGVKYLKVRMTGGGGGGGSSGTGSWGNNATNGGNTTFGTSLLIAEGGQLGSRNAPNGIGGGFTVNSPAINIGSCTGNSGGAASHDTVAGHAKQGGIGAYNPFFGGGPQNTFSLYPGNSAANNSGAGGSGAGGATTAGAYGSGGGSSGGCVYAMIASPAATYAYSIGAGGNGETAGSGGSNGGAGGSGLIVVEEYYQ